MLRLRESVKNPSGIVGWSITVEWLGDMVLLVRFGEIALKSRFVRRQLRDRLVANIQDLFAAEGVECITDSDEARVYVYADEVAQARSILTRVFGVVSISPAVETHADLASLRHVVLSEAKWSLAAGKTFALRTRRGCRIAVAPAPGDPLIEPLRRWDVRLKVLDLPPNGRLGELVKITRADAVFLGTRWASFDPGGRVGLDVPLFEPVIGLSDEEVGRLASQIESA